jgi:uncharacterized protein YndB with AHSA1/START domain
MSDIFSHAAPQPGPTTANLDPRITEVSVPVASREAFDGFTDGIHLWWPLEEYSRFGADSHVGFEEGSLVEESPDGDEYVWGQLRSWEPPSSLELSWQLGGNPLAPTRIIVGFEPREDGGTVVRLVQDGWPEGREGVRMREKFSDWPAILARFVRFMGGSATLH